MAPSGDMHRLETRITSFAAVTRPKRSAKIAFPLDPATYPALTPVSLAAAGFYHTPAPEEEDACSCFLCPLALSGWDEGDNPHIEHVGRDSPCAWKELVCALEVDRLEGGPGRLRTEFASAEELPSSETRTALRVQTFGNWWPHAKPSALELARAGFICTPSKVSPDGTTCPLCKYEVVEWEEDDDPLAIHKRKEPDCPFFTASVKKGRRTTKAAAKRTTRAQTVDESMQEITPESAPAAPKRRGRPPKASTVDVSVQEAEVPEAPKRRGRPPKASATSSANTSTASTTAKPRAKRKTAAEKRAEAEAAAAAEAAEEDSLELPQVPEDSAVLDRPEPTAGEAISPASSRALEEGTERETKPLPRKGRPRKTTPNETKADAEVPSSATRSAPAPKEKETLAPSTADNIPEPPIQAPLKLSKTLPALLVSPDPFGPLASPSAAHAVADMVKAAGGSGSVAISAQDRAMTLEDFVRKQFQVQHDDVRDQAESSLTAWEARAREGRERIERAFA
ncbi:hypothetical protein CspeluHIS016_0400660 [Cutaneotrichosporon spelunceum]|uniref:BIR-domain-containing protein n=1 Tax=Cutaneotrichosporon spelunceum TaxID=1672016 RepID=A0AAD3YCT4_9TREE|nr:hypothetical protein CspeluHIS016_0400660 [Cutaneotrichosporon spelunceum]